MNILFRNQKVRSWLTINPSKFSVGDSSILKMIVRYSMITGSITVTHKWSGYFAIIVRTFAINKLSLTSYNR